MIPERLREAALALQVRAGAVPPSPWVLTAKAERYGGLVSTTAECPPDLLEGYGGLLIAESMIVAVREHVASLHPDVAIALGAFFDDLADMHDEGAIDVDRWPTLSALVDAYLGEDESAEVSS